MRWSLHRCRYTARGRSAHGRLDICSRRHLAVNNSAGLVAAFGRPHGNRVHLPLGGRLSRNGIACFINANSESAEEVP
jgi:hypothetical protein